MIKFIFKSIFVFLLVAVVIGAWGLYSARALPNWFDPEMADSDYVSTTVKEEIGRGGANLFTDKSMQLLKGRVSFSESEFNALVLASLQSDSDGRKLLQISDGIRTFIHQNEVELAAVINLQKLGKVEPRALEAIEKFDKIFWIIEDGRVAISLFGEPVVRAGGLGIKDTFRAKVGEIDFSNDTLRSLKIPVENANRESLAIDFLTLKSVDLNQGSIEFGVRPRL